MKIKITKRTAWRVVNYHITENGETVGIAASAQSAFDFCAIEYPGIEVEVNIQ